MTNEHVWNNFLSKCVWNDGHACLKWQKCLKQCHVSHEAITVKLSTLSMSFYSCLMADIDHYLNFKPMFTSAYAPVHKCAHPNPHTHTTVHKHTYMHKCASIHTLYTHTHTHTHTHTYTHTHTLTQSELHIHTHTHTHTHRVTHTHKNSKLHTCIYNQCT